MEPRWHLVDGTNYITLAPGRQKNTDATRLLVQAYSSFLNTEAQHGMAVATLPAYDMPHPHKPHKETIAFGKFPPLEIDWKQNGNKRLQSFLLENLWKQKILQSPTVQKDWKLFHLQTKQ